MLKKVTTCVFVILRQKYEQLNTTYSWESSHAFLFLMHAMLIVLHNTVGNIHCMSLSQLSQINRISHFVLLKSNLFFTIQILSCFNVFFRWRRGGGQNHCKKWWRTQSHVVICEYIHPFFIFFILSYIHTTHCMT